MARFISTSVKLKPLFHRLNQALLSGFSKEISNIRFIEALVPKEVSFLRGANESSGGARLTSSP
jgi:cation transporter-like permease